MNMRHFWQYCPIVHFLGEKGPQVEKVDCKKSSVLRNLHAYGMCVFSIYNFVLGLFVYNTNNGRDF